MTTPATVRRAHPRVQYVRRDTVAEALAPRLGTTPGTAHQILVGSLPHRVAEVIRAHVVAGAHDRLSRWLAPINDALDGVPTPALSPELLASAQHADGAEDDAQVAYLSDPCERTAHAYSRALGREIAEARRLQLALGAEWGFTC